MSSKKEAVIITRLNPVTSQISHPGLIKDILSYKAEFWQDGRFGKVKREYTKNIVTKGGFFPTGFIKKVKSYLKKQGINYKIKKRYDIIKPNEPNLKGITFYPSQKKVLKKVLKARRGVIEAPTGAGKTIIACAIISAFDTTVLVIVHTKTLYNQFLGDLKRFFGDIGEIKQGKFNCEGVTIAMRQTLARRIKSKKVPKDFPSRWGAIIIDEVHHVAEFSGEYANILDNIYAPIRYGVTATMPSDEKRLLAIEGFVGPLLGKITYEELERVGKLAKPKIKLLKGPPCPVPRSGYQIIYDEGIVHNIERNRMIVKEATLHILFGLTVLIVVDRVEHGHILQKMLKKELPKTFVFLHGKTNEAKVEKEKRRFKKRVRKGIIATKIWNEGVNIPSLDVVLKADCGESDIKTIQTFGRASRTTSKKKDALFIDIVDQHHPYFIKHSLNRLLTYVEKGWLK